jgi:hypothetical protein
MPRRWCLGVTVVIWISICAPVASAQQPPLPGTPTVTVPPVTVPQVTVPPVTVPPVTVPPTPVTPEVTTPPVQTPTVTTPSVSTSSGAASGAGGGSGSGGGQSSSAAGSGSGQSGSGQAGGTGQSGTGQSSGAGASGAGQSGAGRSGTGASGAAKSGSRSGDDAGNAPARLRDRDRNLRRTVLGHEACLGQMPRGERRVLTLRAGVGLAHPRSRAQVQRITGLRRTRVAALERSGLQRLRSLAQAGGCGQAASAAPGAVAPPTGVSGTRGIPDGASIPRIAVLGARESNGAGTAPAPPTGSPDAQRPLLHAPDGAVDLAPAILFVLLAGLVFAAVRDARRSA